MTATILVPLDKHFLLNILKYKDFCMYVAQIAPYRLVFVDEKSLKGAELFNEKGRPDLLTGEVIMRLVGGDFRNTYCLMGMITINKEKGKTMIYCLGMQYVFHMFIVEFCVSLFVNVKLITSKIEIFRRKKSQ